MIERVPIHPWRWRALTIWIVIFSFLVVVALHRQSELTRQNHARVSEIQQSRIESCEATYRKMQQILLVSLEGRPRTPERIQRFERLYALVDPHQCSQQVNPNK